MSGTSRLLALALAGAAATALSGCDESEQDRVLYHEKGVYQGQPDQPLNSEVVDELRSRAKRQGG